MINKKIFYGVGIILIIITAIIVFDGIYSSKPSISLKAIQLDDGWGYEIMLDNKIFISQKYIPAIEGKQVFTNKSDAMKVGRLVVSRLKNKRSPTIKKKDLIDLKLLI